MSRTTKSVTEKIWKILLTSTSFQDNPGNHHELLARENYEIDKLKGPLKENELLDIVGYYDALLCGDDEITGAVLKKGKEGYLRFISKYGVGLDEIDLKAAKELNILVRNCPGVNHVSVAEHVFALLLCFLRKIHLEYNLTKSGKWIRLTGNELLGKTIGIVGLGAIGKEVAKRAICFGLNVVVYDKYIDNDFIKAHKIKVTNSIYELSPWCDIISLHIPLNLETKEIINDELVRNYLKNGVILINTARGKLIDLEALEFGLKNGIISGYLADVLDTEPMPASYGLKDYENVIITPHIGSRTYESVERQGIMAVNNLKEMINQNCRKIRKNG